MKILPVGDLGGLTGRIFTLEMLGMRLEGPNSGHRQTKPSLQDTRWLSSRRPALSSCLLLQPAVLSWAAGGPRAGLSSHSPQWRRIFSITSVWRRSMKAMIFISDPHLGHESGSVS